MNSMAGFTRGERWSRFLPLGHAALFFATGLILSLGYPIGNYGVETDFYADLAPAAQKIAAGTASTSDFLYKGPVYPGFLALMHIFVRDWYRAGVLLNLLCAAGSILLLHRLYRRLYPGSVAAVSAIAVSLVYVFFIDGHKACTDHLFLFLCLLALVILLSGRVGRWRSMLAGAVSGLAFLTRYNGAFLIPGAALSLLLFDPDRQERSRRVRRLLLYLAAFVIVTGPWFALQWTETGHLLQTKNLQSVSLEFYGRRPDSIELAQSFDSFSDLLAHDPVYFIAHYLENLPRHFWLDTRFLVSPLTGILLLLGLLRMLFRPPTRRQTALYVFALCYLGIMAVVFYLPRFSLFLVVSYFPIAFTVLFGDEDARRSRLAGVVERVIRRPGGSAPWPVPHLRAAFSGTALGRRARLLLRVLVLAAVFALQLGQIRGLERVYHATRPLNVLRAARELRELGNPDAPPVVLARKPHFGFHADMATRLYPSSKMTYGDLLTFAHENQVDYILYSPVEYGELTELRFLAVLDSLPGLDLVYRKQGVSVFRVAPAPDLDRAYRSEPRLKRRMDWLAATGAGDVRNALLAAQDLALSYLAEGDRRTARRYLERALALARRKADPQIAKEAAVLRGNLAVLSMEEGRIDEAGELLRRNLAELSGSGDAVRIAQVHRLLARYFELQGDRAEAIRHLETARDLLRSAGETGMAAEMEKLRSSLAGKGTGGASENR